MFSSTQAVAVLGLATLARSHMMMLNPVPFGKSSLTNSPLDASGSDFPCKQRTGVYDAEGASNTMALGSTQSMSFIGGATHGGGSCQISITYDEKPTASSTWKVIHSIEGGCPIRNVAGNNGASATNVDPDTYSYTIPASLPTGTAVLAWTWFNKVGNREMYMNCAPLTLTATSSKRSDEDELSNGNYSMLMERDTAAYNALPNMFVANIGNGCGTLEGNDVIFPNPGDSVEKNGVAATSPVSTFSGACAAATGGPASAASSAAGSSAKTSVTPASTASVSGGVFITVSPTSSSPALATSSVASSATTLSVAPVSSAAASSPVKSVASTVVASSSTPASTGSSTGTSGSGSAFAAGTACTTEGEWNCIGGTSFQQCASGTWSVVQQLAAGTSCNAGETTKINIVAAAGKKERRAVRFSGSHLRRHIHKS